MDFLGDLVDVKTAAELLGGISPWTIQMWLSQGKLVRVKVGGRTMVRKSELEKFVVHGGKGPVPQREPKPRKSKKAV